MSNPELNEELLDVRVVERNIIEGKLERTQWDTYLADLPDDAENCVETEVRMGAEGEAVEAAAAEAPAEA